jgi:hypothetical protein
MDDADISDERIQNVINDGIERARRMKGRNLPVTGACHWCSEPVSGRAFCSKECSDDWQADMEARKRNGK